MSTFKLTVSSPDGDIFKGEAEKLVLRGSEGDLAVLAGHTPFMTSVKPGECRIHIDSETVKKGKISGGMLAVSESSVTLLSGSIVFE